MIDDLSRNDEDDDDDDDDSNDEHVLDTHCVCWALGSAHATSLKICQSTYGCTTNTSK